LMRLFIVLVAIFVVAVGARGHHGHHDHHDHHLRPSRFLRHHLPQVKLDETKELDTVHPRTVIADTTAAASELEVEVDLDADSTKSNSTISATTAESGAEPDLRVQMAKMSARIEQLEAQLKQVQPPPLPPRLAHFLHSLGHTGPHDGPLHAEDEHNVRFEAWRHWHEQHHHRHHPLLCFILFTAIIYGMYKCTKRCCCNASDGANVYPAYVHGNGNGNGLPTARGGVVHNPYVGVESQTATFVPSAENPRPVATAVVPSAPAPMAVGGVPQHQLQHGVVLGTPVSLTG